MRRPRCLPPRRRTKQGLEMQMGVNWIGHMHLVNQLLPVMKKQVRVCVCVCDGEGLTCVHVYRYRRPQRSVNNMLSYAST